MNFITLEHRRAESKGLRFESSWGLTIVSLSHARGKTKNIFLYFFTKLKTYYIPHSIYFRIIWTFQFRFIIAYTQELRVLAVKHP